MPWIPYRDSHNAHWRFNSDGLWTLVRQYQYAQLLSTRSHLVEDHDGGWFAQTLGLRTYHVDTDFASIRQSRDQLSHDLLRNLTASLLEDGRATFNALVRMRSEMLFHQKRFRALLQQASSQTSEGLNRFAAHAKQAENVARFVRDACFTGVVVGAGLLTGGTALTALSGGSVLRGIAKYQDSGNVGSAILTVAGTFTVGTVSMAPALGQAGEAVKLGSRAAASAAPAVERIALRVVSAQLDASFEAAGSFAEGKSMRESFQQAGVRFALSATSDWLTSGLDRIALPVIVKLASNSAVSMTADAAVDAAGSIGQRPLHRPPPMISSHIEPFAHCSAGIPGCYTDREYVSALVLRPM